MCQIQYFHERLKDDKRLHSSHVSLYMALLIMWNQNLFANPFVITRKDLMRLSKLGSIATYQKCIYELVAFGYIEYKPTFNSFVGTKVYIHSSGQLY